MSHHTSACCALHVTVLYIYCWTALLLRNPVEPGPESLSSTAVGWSNHLRLIITTCNPSITSHFSINQNLHYPSWSLPLPLDPPFELLDLLNNNFDQFILKTQSETYIFFFLFFFLSRPFFLSIVSYLLIVSWFRTYHSNIEARVKLRLRSLPKSESSSWLDSLVPLPLLVIRCTFLLNSLSQIWSFEFIGVISLNFDHSKLLGGLIHLSRVDSWTGWWLQGWWLTLWSCFLHLTPYTHLSIWNSLPHPPSRLSLLMTTDDGCRMFVGKSPVPGLEVLTIIIWSLCNLIPSSACSWNPEEIVR